MEVTGEGTCRGATEEQREGRCHQKGELQQHQVSSRQECGVEGEGLEERRSLGWGEQSCTGDEI